MSGDNGSGDAARGLASPRSMALLLLVALLFSIGIVVASDGEVRSVADGDNSYMDDADHLTSAVCEDCHDDPVETWMVTGHAGAFGPATTDTVVGDFSAEPTIEVAPGVTVEPVLIVNGTGLYMDLDGEGTHVYEVTHVQGAGIWLQVYLSEQGNTRYILPFAWANTVQAWVPFHTEEWFDDQGTPMMAEKDWVWDLLCVACHTVGAHVEHNGTSGEWRATWEEDGVACEACHGPGSLHKKPPSGGEKVDFIWRDLDSAVCGNCHTGMTSVGKVGGVNTIFGLSVDGRTIRPGDAHEDFFVHAPDLHPDGETVKGQAMQYNDYITSRHSHSLTTLKNAEGREDFCLMCHSTDFVLAEEGEEPDLETALHDIECALCHDSHGTEFENNLRVDKWDTCVQCHRNGDRVPGQAPLPPHKEVLLGEIPIDGLVGEPWMDGKALCTDCHMAPMAVREVPYDIPSHTWYFVSPGKSIDLGMPNSCTVACHGDDTPGPTMTDEEALSYIEDKSALIEDLLADAEGAVAQAEDALVEAEDLGFTPTEIEAANATYVNALFALEFIHEDKSMIHNPTFQMSVLNYSIEKGNDTLWALMPGTVTGFVKDADGKAVQYAEVRMGDKVWGTTSGDGSFEFRVAPGEHDFEVYVGDKRKASFSATVAAGETADAGTIRFKAESEAEDNTIYILVALVVIIVLILVVVMMARRNKVE